MVGVRLESNVVSYNAGISAGEKGRQWQLSLALLREMRESKLVPDVISYSSGASACEKAERWQLALLLLGEMREAKLAPNSSATALGSARARRASSGSAPCRCSARCVRRTWSPASFSYNAGVSACEKGDRWQSALALLSEMREAMLEPNVIYIYSAGISACEKGRQWQRALALLSEMQEAKLEPNAISYTAGISACEKGRANSGSRCWRC
ncbi:unnamed protein product [Prorocentrum cordatum]|uniref:Pentacotripeptide-repeat region of PRORP domain-containing protein n=1 Tax=Prorocentrum cordatum TaxID=2364126 RepID=A0ABN9W0B2_9DINO|nr:unnamed protein product [Polarella glacialis]